MQKHVLNVTKRDIFGKKLKRLRKDNVIPGNIYGKGLESVSVQVSLKDFQETYKAAGETGLVEIHLEGQTRPVLIHHVQQDYLTHKPLHADFYQVNLKEKVKTMVPVELTGEPKAVADKLGLLLQIINEVEVEALPADLPEKLTVDVAHLATVNDQVTVADIQKSGDVTILTGAEETVAKISELVSKEAEEQAAAEAAAAEAAKAEGAEASAEGEAKPATEKAESEEKKEEK